MEIINNLPKIDQMPINALRAGSVGLLSDPMPKDCDTVKGRLLATEVGTLNDLTTTEKDSIVEAVNELNGIIEWKTSGNWKYLEYPDGTVDLRYYETVASLACTTNYNSQYYGLVVRSLPFELDSLEYPVTASARNASLASVANVQLTSTDAVSVIIWCPISFTGSTRVSIYITGKKAA